jgi:hypothetical protein
MSLVKYIFRELFHGYSRGFERNLTFSEEYPSYYKCISHTSSDLLQRLDRCLIGHIAILTGDHSLEGPPPVFSGRNNPAFLVCARRRKDAEISTKPGCL